MFADKENETPRDYWFLHVLPHVAKLYTKPSGPTLSAGTALRVSFSKEGTSMRTCLPVAAGYVPVIWGAFTNKRIPSFPL